MTDCRQCGKLLEKRNEVFCTWTCLRLWKFNNVAVLGSDWRRN